MNKKENDFTKYSFVHLGDPYFLFLIFFQNFLHTKIQLFKKKKTYQEFFGKLIYFKPCDKSLSLQIKNNQKYSLFDYVLT